MIPEPTPTPPRDGAVKVWRHPEARRFFLRAGKPSWGRIEGRWLPLAAYEAMLSELAALRALQAMHGQPASGQREETRL